MLDLIAEVKDGAVLCSHGDVIPATVEALVRRGMQLKTEPDWRKASVWVLRRKDDRVVTRHRLAPTHLTPPIRPTRSDGPDPTVQNHRLRRDF